MSLFEIYIDKIALFMNNQFYVNRLMKNIDKNY